MKKFLGIFSLKNKNNGRNDFLKVVAIVTMAIDHIGVVFFPSIAIFRIIGRLSLPIFAIGIADGYKYTSDLKKYLLRIMFVGFISQIPFVLALNNFDFNILFSFLFSLCLLYVIDKRFYIGLIPLLVAFFIFPTSYGWYGIAMIIIFYLLREKRLLLISALAVLVAVYSLENGSFIDPFQMLGIFLVIYLPKDFCKINIPRNIFYWFYPLHLIILFIINLFIK